MSYTPIRITDKRGDRETGWSSFDEIIDEVGWCPGSTCSWADQQTKTVLNVRWNFDGDFVTYYQCSQFLALIEVEAFGVINNLLQAYFLDLEKKK